MTETGMRAAAEALTSRWVVRRTVYLLIGGAVALAFLMLGSVLASPVQGASVTDLRVPAAVGLVLMIGVGLLPGLREVQVAAAQTLLGATDVSVPVPMRWTHRWRTALWTVVHQLVGFAVGVGIALAALAVSVLVALIGGQQRIDTIWQLDRPDNPGTWLVVIGVVLAVIGAAVALTVGGGLAARWSAPLLLGSSGDDRLAAAERRLRREQEYRRLSRDLHDGVGHALSAISLQAVAGERIVRDDPDQAAATLSSIQSLAADAVGELDQVLGVLRDGAAPTGPEPTLADVPALVRRQLDLGVPIDLDMDPDLHVPGPLSRLAYRICAEALSNAAKHAGPGPVALQVAVRDGDLMVRAVNRLGTGPARSGRGGHGLAGLTESVEVFGGTVTAGPDGNDWVLQATVPMGGGRG